MKRLAKVYFGLLYLLPAVLFCPYYPVIRLGSNASMNFELSLPLIFLVVFDFVALLSLITHGQMRDSFKKLFATNEERAKRGVPITMGDDEAGFVKKLSSDHVGISDKRFFLFSLFPFYATISSFWSPNPTRAILTAGIIWLLFFAVFAVIFITPLLHPSSTFRSSLLKSFFISSIAICLFCWIQSILDVFGVTREYTLLCTGCVSQTFGFPHPSGLAIEPQFMGNLLLAPTLTALYLLVFQPKPLKRRQFWLLVAAASLFSATLFLTFSRGAIYAFAIALIVLFIFALVRHQFRATLIAIPVLTFMFTLAAQGIFNVVGPIHDSFISGVTKSIHQFSLGIIDLRPGNAISNDEPDNPAEVDVESDDQSSETAIFDGYIAESTDIRLGLNSVALRTWSSSPSSILFGVGLGGAGIAMHSAFPEAITTSKEIVQNQPFSLLLELGLVGSILVLFSLCLAFFPQIFPRKFIDGRSASTSPSPTFWQHPALPLLCSLILAYLVTLQFFSGLPNALQIYLLPPLIYLIWKTSCHGNQPVLK